MFYQNSETAIKILGIFRVERKKRELSEWDRKYTAISYRIRGNSKFTWSGKALVAKGGSVSYIPAGCDYKRTTLEDEELIVFHLKTYGKTERDIQVKENAADLEPLFRTLLQTWEEGAEFHYNRCMALVYRIFERLELIEKEAPSGIPEAILPGVKILRKNYRDPHLTVTSLAQASFISEVYFRRLYRSYFGKTPWQAIQELRFRYACGLLRSGYYSPKQAAELSGFSDVKYFRTAFQKYMGISPTKFMKKNA